MNKDHDPALRGLRLMAVKAEGDALAMANLARTMRRMGQGTEAISLALRARALAPDDGEVAVVAAEVLSHKVPRWHPQLLRDRARNEAYRRAIERAVNPGSTVLEIGAGTGLLAMMAARAGARRVITCECDPAMAEVARRTVAANGYADRITVLEMPSTAIDAARDLGGPADILVSEIVSDALLTEGVLPSHADAIRRLLAPGAKVIPGRGRMRVALAHYRHLDRGVIGCEEGFDLSALNLVRAPRLRLPAHDPDVAIVGPAADLFTFDFAAELHPRQPAEVRLDCDGGEANGVLQWLALDLIDDLVFENRPSPTTRSNWGCIFWPFPGGNSLGAGQAARIGARHDGLHSWLWVKDR